MGSIALLVLVCTSSCLLLPHPAAAATAPKLPVRAVNLGGWLVTEGWIKPSLFYGIRNNDTMDGTQLQFMSATQKRYLVADKGGGAAILADRVNASGWETFRLWRINETTFNLRVNGGQFWGVNNTGALVATATTPGQSETFQLVRRDSDKSRVRIRAPNGLFLQVKTMASVTADYGQNTNWSDNDPSVFVTNNVGGLQGEYQLCNGYGIANATQVLMNHRNIFITERDFNFMASSRLNAVRVPVGWWIASGDNPPPPFVGGSLQFLDKAFSWGQKYNISVIVTLHAAPGSQNPYEHSATRDGSQEWGNTDENIAQTVQVIDFLAKRYANNTALLAIELLNEPLAPGANLSVLTKYYQDGYNAVRRYTPASYVIMSNRLNIANQTEILQFVGSFVGAVLDVHYYNLFDSKFDSLTVEQNIDFVRNNRSSDLKAITNQNGRPLTFVGEWSAAWGVQGANKTDYQRFAKVQQDVYGNATFGWAYWTLQNPFQPWNMTYMIQNGIMTLRS
ncbi:probable glucan 1,3-beta-glucosidase A [Miscanthus floridulus]|uniref:probable glucan 1,3-beta-glucosidase A n=1 Tax=Miscanthus floridulus TaxID=154761 RepID=UPI003459CA71